jgi:hypothetical protein
MAENTQVRGLNETPWTHRTGLWSGCCRLEPCPPSPGQSAEQDSEFDETDDGRLVLDETETTAAREKRERLAEAPGRNLLAAQGRASSASRFGHGFTAGCGVRTGSRG